MSVSTDIRKVSATGINFGFGFFDDGLGYLSDFDPNRDMLIPASDANITMGFTLKYSDNRPAPGIVVNASSRPETLIGPEWRTVNGLVTRWPADSQATLRERISQGIVRLGATFKSSSVTSDANGNVTFICNAWHVSGNEAVPSSDRLIFRWDGGEISNIIIKCGVPNLETIPNNQSKGITISGGATGLYLQSPVNQALLSIADAWKRTSGRPQGMPDFITITEGSLRWGGLIPPHLTHRFGGTVDVRPISTDGGPTRVGAPNYSKVGTEVLIDYFVQTGATQILFADNLKGVSRLDPNHSDHLHVSWLNLPTEPWLLIKQQQLFSNLNILSLKDTRPA